MHPQKYTIIHMVVSACKYIVIQAWASAGMAWGSLTLPMENVKVRCASITTFSYAKK